MSDMDTFLFILCRHQCEQIFIILFPSLHRISYLFVEDGNVLIIVDYHILECLLCDFVGNGFGDGLFELIFFFEEVGDEESIST